MNKVDYRMKNHVLHLLRLITEYAEYLVIGTINTIKSVFNTKDFLISKNRYVYVKDQKYDLRKDLNRLLRE